MIRKKFITLLLLLLFFCMFALRTFANPTAEVTVTGADATLQLPSVIDSMANTILSSVPARVSIQFSNSLRQEDLSLPPSTLMSKLNLLPDHITQANANSLSKMSLNYPLTLINDTTNPQITVAPKAEPVSDSIVNISWETDEYTTYALHIGINSGNYPEIINSTTFSKTQQVAVTDLTSGQTYYFIIISTDLSGNEATSQEYNFEFKPEHLVYLPTIIR